MKLGGCMEEWYLVTTSPDWLSPGIDGGKREDPRPYPSVLPGPPWFPYTLPLPPEQRGLRSGAQRRCTPPAAGAPQAARQSPLH